MKTEEAKKANVNDEQKIESCPANKLEGTETTNEGKEKKGFWKNLGKGVKIGLCVAGGVVLTGVTWLVVTMLGGKDDEPEAAEATETEPTDE